MPLKKQIYFLTGSLIILILLGYAISIRFSQINKNNRTPSSQIKVVATIFPLYDLAKIIGGSAVQVDLLLPPGAEAHSFEPRPSDIIKINEADIFIYTGGLMEPWAHDLLKSVRNKNLLIINASESIKLAPNVLSNQNKPSGSSDPHIWLDFDNLTLMLKNIQSGFVTKDPIHTTSYQQAAFHYAKKLQELDNLYRTTLASCQNHKIIYAGHYAFGYLAQRYKLEYFAAQGLAPDAEPTAPDLANLLKQINSEQIKYIFYEELASPKIAETIAQESGAQLLLLNAAHNITKEQLAQGLNLLEIFNNNLANLQVGLNCQ
ncbi:MAG: zinc ABC transporter substrate-binding protein [Patescibacteria group bacterium]